MRRVARFVGLLLLVLMVLGLGPGRLATGNRLYREGRFEEAAAAYQDALRRGETSPALHYNLGTSLLQLGRHEEAEIHLRQALQDLDPELRQRTLYNLGNRFLDEGRGAAAPESLQLLDAAVVAYKAALRIRPDDTDAKFNLELALREQEEQRAGGATDEDEGDPEDRDEGGAGDAPAPAEPRPEPGAREPGQGLTQEQAEQILAAAEQDERDVYRERLLRGRREVPVDRDW